MCNTKNMHLTAIINRAVSGSGKTTISNCITESLKNADLSIGIHSTDKFFMQDGHYIFDIKKLGEYHRKNLDNFISDMRHGLDVVICDNMNLMPWQAEPYTEAARKYRYKIIFINFLTRGLEKHLEAQQVTPEKPDAHNLTKDLLVRFIDDFQAYNNLLDKNAPVDTDSLYNYYWDEKMCERVRIETPIKHFDSDFVITVKPEDYHELKQSIGTKILELILMK